MSSVPANWLDDGAIVVDERTPKKSRKKKARGGGTGVKASTALDHEKLRGRAMQKRMDMSARIWCTDGEFLWFRPRRMVNGEMKQVANPAICERHERFVRKGDLTFLGNQDDVSIWKVNPQSPFHSSQGLYLERMTEGQIMRACVVSAMKRDWPLYADILEDLAKKIKGTDIGPLGGLRWKEALDYIQQQIDQRRGPSSDECGRGLQDVRAKRGQGGRMIMLR